MKIALFLFVVLPITEMWILIKVGDVIGAFATIGLVLLTAAIGLALLRQQGFSTLLRARGRLESGEVPAREMIEAIFLAVGGALLLTPGFITDFVGFCCLIPGVRQALIGWALRHVVVQGGANVHFRDKNGRGQDHKIIEGDYKRED